ncbi:MAG: sigma-70 family RNA polymerase sigma factor, partial [Planctomycetes bacterium]|nr:sigma-70 family RNA polymerase sigma factor [Planctomycetota bacterium]
KAAINVAYRMVSDPHTAQDIAQEAFLKILDNANNYRPTAKFRTYLYNVVSRLCIDHYRKRRASPSAELAHHKDNGESPSEAMIRNERAEKVRAALNQLPERQRTALVLQHYEDLSYEEIAEVMDCSTKAVDSLLVRARRKLEQLLADLK